jgi:hypothetical protein
MYAVSVRFVSSFWVIRERSNQLLGLCGYVDFRGVVFFLGKFGVGLVLRLFVFVFGEFWKGARVEVSCRI